MEERSGKEVRVYISEGVYTTLQKKSQKLGITMSALVRSYIIYAIDNKIVVFND